MSEEELTSFEPSIGAGAGLPVVPISWGELFDKIAILQLKEARLGSERQVENVRRELALLNRFGSAVNAEGLGDLLEELRAVNERLWGLEDEIRELERGKDFSEEFIAVSRALYQENDRRAALKQRINGLLGSELREEKSYKPY